MAKVKNGADVRVVIMKKLKSEERSLLWLARKTDIAYGTLYNCFVHKIVALKQEQLDTINEVLGTNFK